MSYTPTEWNTGDVITAEKLNNIEAGIVSHDAYIVTSTNDDSLSAFVLDKTYAEILAATKSGKNVIIKLIWGDDAQNTTYCTVISINERTDSLYVHIIDPRSTLRIMSYSASSIDDYPKFQYD